MNTFLPAPARSHSESSYISHPGQYPRNGYRDHGRFPVGGRPRNVRLILQFLPPLKQVLFELRDRLLQLLGQPLLVRAGPFRATTLFEIPSKLKRIDRRSPCEDYI